MISLSAYAAVREDARGEAKGRGGQPPELKGARPQSKERAHRALPEHQAKALEQAGPEGVGVVWGEKMQSPLSVRGQDLGVQRAFSGGKGLRTKKGAPWKDNAIAVMDNLSPLFGIADAEAEFEVKRMDEDKLGFRHVRLTQRHQGLRVVGGEVIVHFNGDEAAYEVNGQYAPGIEVNTQPGVTGAAATKTAQDDMQEMGFADAKAAKGPELVVYAVDGAEPRLAYEMTLVSKGAAGKLPRVWRYWVDAQTGGVLQKYNDARGIDEPTENGQEAQIQGNILEGEGGQVVQVEGWQENGYYYLYNTNLHWVVFNDSPLDSVYPDADDYAHRLTNDWGDSDRTEMSAAYNVNIVQQYYLNVHGRNSYDNKGSMVEVYAHFGFNYVNAGWLPPLQVFIVGDGDGETADSLAVLDVMGHELTHAVTEHTAGLEYITESGALNESFSDIFGVCIEFYAQPDGSALYPGYEPGTANWLMGEDCWISSTALRDMRNPRNSDTVDDGVQPSRYQGTYWEWGMGDNGGVHQNSGVHNFFFYLLCEGGAGDNDGLAYDVQGIGMQKAEQIAYRVLTVYCTAYTGYAGVREAWYSATRDLYPECLTSVRCAWDAVMGSQEPPVILTEDPLPDGRVGNFYSVSFLATSPSPIIKWYLVDGVLPDLLTFTPAGKLSGYCLQSGTYTFSVAVEANNGLMTTNEFSIYIFPPLEMPLSEDFEQGMMDASMGWSQQLTFGGIGWRIKNGGILQNKPAAAVEGTKNAYLGRWNDSVTLNLPEHESWLVSPMIRFPAGARAAQLRFYLYMEKWSDVQDELRVYCKTGLFGDWGEPVATYTQNINVWTLQVIDLPPPSSSGGDYFIAFQGHAIGGCGICLDAIWLGDPIPALAIITPSILPVALVETNYVNLIALESEGGWSDDPGEYTYEVISGSLPEGFGLTPDGVVTGCSATVQSSTFLVQVTDSHGRTATKEMTLSVELPRAPLFEEEFEGPLSGQGWTQEWHPQTGNNIYWRITKRDGYDSKLHLPAYDAHSPTLFAWLYGVPSASSVMKVKLVSKPFDLTQAPNNTRLSFWHLMKQQSGKQDQLTVYYRTSTSSPWVALANYNENVTNWTHRVIALPNLSSTYQIAFEGYVLGGSGVAVDTVSITDDAAAPIITTLSTLPGSFVGFPYYTTLSAIGGMPPYAWALVSGALPPGLTINADGEISGTPTDPGTSAFSIEVMGADGKASTNSFSLRILMPGDIPFEEKLDSPTLPDGWTLERVQGTVDWVIAKGTVCPYGSAQPKMAPTGLASNACLWTASVVGTSTARLVSPPINLGSLSSDAILTFQHFMMPYFTYQDRLRVRYRASLTDDWTTVAEFTGACSKWTPRTVILPNPSSTYYIAFEGVVRGGYGVCVGDVVIMGEPEESLSPYEIWQREHFTEEELTYPAISGPDADPDEDGIPNLMEYAMGLDPRSGDANIWIWGGLTNVVNHAEVPTGNYLYLKYRRKNVVEGVKFTVIGTPSLTPPDLNWTPLDIYEFNPWTPGTEPEVWSWVYNIHLVPSTNWPTRFMRLRLELE